MKEITIVIADDHPVVREGVRGMLASQPEFIVIAEAHNGAEAVRLAKHHQPDVMLMDISMPVMDGIEATTAIVAANVPTNIIVLTTYDNDLDIGRALQAGAKGYLLKDTPRFELFKSIRSVADGATQVGKQLERRRSNDKTHLSEREIEVLQRVSVGMSNVEIGRNLHISAATVKTHLIHIYRKLGVSDRTAAVTVAIERRIIRVGK